MDPKWRGMHFLLGIRADPGCKRRFESIRAELPRGNARPPRSRTGEEPLNQNLFYKLAARSRPSRPALHVTDGATVSFGELFRQSGQVANALVAMGVKPGDRVAVQVEKSVSALVLYLAVLR